MPVGPVEGDMRAVHHELECCGSPHQPIAVASICEAADIAVDVRVIASETGCERGGVGIRNGPLPHDLVTAKAGRAAAAFRGKLVDDCAPWSLIVRVLAQERRDLDRWRLRGD